MDPMAARTSCPAQTHERRSADVTNIRDASKVDVSSVLIRDYCKMILRKFSATAVLSVFLFAALIGAPGKVCRAQQLHMHNYVVNGDFENGMTGWSWKASKADAASQIVTTDSHSGQSCLRMTNNTPYGPNVFGSLSQLITGLRPNTTYELSAWIKSTAASGCWIGGGPRWTTRKDLPSDAVDWQRESLTFATGPADITWQLLINTDAPTQQLLIDDIVVMDAPVKSAWFYAPSIGSGNGVSAASLIIASGRYEPQSYDAAEMIAGTLTVPSGDEPHPAGTIALRLTGEPEVVDLGGAALPARAASSLISLKFVLPAELLLQGKNTVSAYLDDSSVPIAAVQIVRRDLVQQIADRLADCEVRLSVVRQRAGYAGLSANAYARLGLSVAARFINRVKTRGASGAQSASWSWLQLHEVDQVLDETDGLIRNPLANVDLPTGSSVIGQEVLTAGGRPVFYGGYCGWKDVVSDIPIFRPLGASLIQQDYGPGLLSRNGAIAVDRIDRIEKTFDDAARNGIKIDFLLSPHYFPQWAMDESPDVKIPSKAFIKFNINHPLARRVLEQWIADAVGALGKEPALFSFCLSNEPVYDFSGRDPYSKPLWTKYLQSVHSDITTLNALYGTRYASFSDVPVPEAGVPPLSESAGALRAYYDWLNFNDYNFANWHRWMNSLVKAAAPSAPTDDKILGSHMFDRWAMSEGVDPEVFCKITDLAGDDDYMSPPGVGPHGDYACYWQPEEMGYDLLRSFYHQPLIDSENHFIPDRDADPVSGDYGRAVMWQGALHGQGATATWVWGEAPDAASALSGSLYYRPAVMFGVGRAWLDESRLSDAVAAVIRAKPSVALLYSRTSLYWQPDYADCLQIAYTALDMLGEPVTFVTEQELANGRTPSVAAIVLPRATHVSAAAVAGLEAFVKHGGRLIAIGQGNLGKDQYDRDQTIPSDLAPTDLSWPKDDRAIQAAMRPLLVSLGRFHPLIDKATGAQAFGVEYRVVTVNGKRYLSAINYMKTPVTIGTFELGTGRMKDLLSGEIVNPSKIVMQPMAPRLLYGD